MKYFLGLTILVTIFCSQVTSEISDRQNGIVKDNQTPSNTNNSHNRNLAQGRNSSKGKGSRDGSPNSKSKAANKKQIPLKTPEKLGDYKVGTDEDWQKFEDEFEADDLFQLVISKRRSINFEQEVENVSADTKVYMNFMSYTLKDKPIPIDFQIFDQNDKLLLDKKKLTHHVVKLTPKKHTIYKFKLYNANNVDVRVLAGVDCKHCGSSDEKYMDKVDFAKKLLGLHKIQKDLAHYQMYLTRSKGWFYNMFELADSSSWNLILSCMIEMACYVGITVWQVVFIKNLMVKRRII